MNPINLNGGGEIDARRTTGRLDADRINETSTAAVSPQTTPAQAAPLPSDSVKVSERASAIGELTAKAEALPDVRQERVNQLRARVESGDYQPTSDQIADALLKESQASTSPV
jgi:negative regulator of flagellin synthesis FlgM